MATQSEFVAPYWQVFVPPMIDKSTTEFEKIEYQQRNANQWISLMVHSTPKKLAILMRIYYHIKPY